MKQLSTQDKNLNVSIGETNLNLRKIFSNSTKFCSGGDQKIFIRTADSVSEPYLLTKLLLTEVSDSEIKFTVSDEEEKFFAELSIKSSSKGISFSAKVNSKIPIWLFEWKLSGFDFDEVIIPALGGQSVSKDIPNGTVLSYKYPFWWSAQFALGMKNSDGLIFRTEDSGTDLKLLRVGKEKGKFSITFGFEAKAPLQKKELKAEMFIDSFVGGWKKGVQMIERLHEWKKLYNPKNTLLYLPGFAEHGIDSKAPSYNPSNQCGGEKEFKRLIDTAHKLGYRVMIHTNVLAMTYTHPLYKNFKKYQVVDVFNRPQGWAMDIDGDWLTEPFFAYMNPGYKAWGDLMSKILGELIKKYKLDGVFLDQTLLAFNINKGPDFVKGMRDHVQRLQKDFPKILFAGEGLHEQNVSALPMAQIHGIDSIAEVHGMEGQAPWKNAHPVSSYLFGKYTKYTAHLLTKHPSHPMFKLQEDAYKKLNVVPALCLYNFEQKMNLPEVKKMIERVKKLK
jgi:hypothetical protein